MRSASSATAGAGRKLQLPPPPLQLRSCQGPLVSRLSYNSTSGGHARNECGIAPGEMPRGALRSGPLVKLFRQFTSLGCIGTNRFQETISPPDPGLGPFTLSGGEKAELGGAQRREI